MRDRLMHTTGHLEVIVGPMFSGKSEELIRRVTRAVIARQSVAVFKPAIDDRYHQTQVASHNGRSIEAHAVQSSEDIRNLVCGNTPLLPSETALPDVIAIDGPSGQ
jgi:thymidine kinase